jgi:hypothetical protein
MTVRRLRRLLPSALAALAVVGWAASPAQARPTAEEYAGINIQKLIFEFPSTAWFGHFNAMERAGMKLVRFDALWQRIEPDRPSDGRHTYRWERFDPIVGELAKRGIRWLPIIAYSARWAAVSSAHYAAAPRDPAEYAEFAGAVARRYGRNGSFWAEHPEIPAVPVSDYEIWNAPNNAAHWYPSPDPAKYAAMYIQSRAAIRAADPEADAWIGGLEGTQSVNFVRDMYRARPELQGSVDAVAIHPYAPDPARVLPVVTELRRFLDVIGAETAGIPVTEIGWATQGEGPGWRVSDSRRAEYLAELAERLGRSDCGAWTFMPHTWTTKEQNPFAAGDWFGIVRPDTAPTQTSTRYAQALENVRRQGAADVPLCDRQIGVAVSRRVNRVVRSVRQRSRRTGRVTRVRRPYRRTCHVALVKAGSSPLDGATVHFEYEERRGRRRHVRTVDRTTLSDGTAHVCRTRPVRRRRSNRPLILRRITTSHDDFVRGAAASRRLTLP